jgi:hypothetical protein
MLASQASPSDAAVDAGARLYGCSGITVMGPSSMAARLCCSARGFWAGGEGAVGFDSPDHAVLVELMATLSVRPSPSAYSVLS